MAREKQLIFLIYSITLYTLGGYLWQGMVNMYVCMQSNKEMEATKKTIFLPACQPLYTLLFE